MGMTAEKAMAPHSSTLAWKIPWMEESGGLQSMGSLGVGHDWGDLAVVILNSSPDKSNISATSESGSNACSAF